MWLEPQQNDNDDSGRHDDDSVRNYNHRCGHDDHRGSHDYDCRSHDDFDRKDRNDPGRHQGRGPQQGRKRGHGSRGRYVQRDLLSNDVQWPSRVDHVRPTATQVRREHSARELLLERFLGHAMRGDREGNLLHGVVCDAQCS
jgi:hypothetical protein